MADPIVAVTGANGFVGRGVVRALTTRRRYAVHAITRAQVGDIGPGTNWTGALAGVDTLVHLAARVHVIDERAADALSAYRRVNTDGTRRLAEQAAAAGVRRLVFLSTLKVHGEVGTPGAPFRVTDAPAPVSHYAVSKWEAERALREVAADTGMEVVIIRPPLVYGTGVGANFARLVRWVRSGVPLPFGRIDNRRSLVGLDNLASLILRCIDAEAAAGQVFLASDDEDLSTPELIRRIADATGRSARLVPVPVRWLRAVGRVTGREAEIDRLVGSLQADIRQTCETLGWRPPVSVDEGLRRVVSGGVK